MTPSISQVSEAERHRLMSRVQAILADKQHVHDNEVSGMKRASALIVDELAAALAASQVREQDTKRLLNDTQSYMRELYSAATATERGESLMLLKLETWISSDNKREQHYYLPNGTYEGLYVVGFNPDLLSAATRAMILDLVKKDLENGRATL